MNTRHFSWFAATTIWLINPVFSGCDSHTDNAFQFDESDMIALLDDLNGEVWETEFNGVPSTVTVDVSQVVEEQASLWSMVQANTASACGTRNFVGRAEACVEMSTLPVEGVITIQANHEETYPLVYEVSGSIDVFGTTLNNAEVWLSNDDVHISWSGYTAEGEDSLLFELNGVQ